MVDDDIVFSVTPVGSRLGRNEFGTRSVSFYKLRKAAENKFRRNMFI
jgi:hypothetical protein